MVNNMPILPRMPHFHARDKNPNKFLIFSFIGGIISQMNIDYNQIFAAPMAGITDRPFRRIIREFAPNANLVTEMISCHSLVAAHKNCLRNFDLYADEGNIGTQIFGADISLMADAAKILADNGAKWIDINMGCPVPKVATRANAGAYLMRDHVLAGKIINAVVRSVNIPVSIKTRLGWDDAHRDWAELVRVAADNGASFVVLHGRTRAQLYNGAAILPDVHNSPIPIIANGDISDLGAIENAKQHGYAGAMIGRAMLGKPWIIGALSGETGRPDNIGAVVLRHLDYAVEYYGARNAIPMFRKHVAWYSAGMPNSTDFRIRVNTITDPDELKSEISKFWGCQSA